MPKAVPKAVEAVEADPARPTAQPQADEVPPGQAGGPPGTEPPGQGPPATNDALNALNARYAGAVSYAVGELDPLLEWLRLYIQEAQAHPDQPRGEAAAGRLREAEQTLTAIYERLRRMSAPTAITG